MIPVFLFSKNPCHRIRPAGPWGLVCSPDNRAELPRRRGPSLGAPTFGPGTLLCRRPHSQAGPRAGALLRGFHNPIPRLQRGRTGQSPTGIGEGGRRTAEPRAPGAHPDPKTGQGAMGLGRSHWSRVVAACTELEVAEWLPGWWPGALAPGRGWHGSAGHPRVLGRSGRGRARTQGGCWLCHSPEPFQERAPRPRPGPGLLRWPRATVTTAVSPGPALSPWGPAGRARPVWHGDGGLAWWQQWHSHGGHAASPGPLRVGGSHGAVRAGQSWQLTQL